MEGSACLLELPGGVCVPPEVWVIVSAVIPERGIYLDVRPRLSLAILWQQPLRQVCRIGALFFQGSHCDGSSPGRLDQAGRAWLWWTVGCGPLYTVA